MAYAPVDSHTLANIDDPNCGKVRKRSAFDVHRINGFAFSELSPTMSFPSLQHRLMARTSEMVVLFANLVVSQGLGYEGNVHFSQNL